MSIALPDLTATVKAVDEASGVFEKVQASAEESMGQVEQAAEKVTAAHEKTGAGLKGIVTGFAGVATSAFALYNAYDRVQDMQVSVSRANVQVQSSLNSLEDAQRRYNAAIERHGIDSEEASVALKDLQLAEERYSVAVERAQMIQGNLNEAMVQSAISVIPTAITMIDSLIRAKQSWVAAQAALNVVMNMNPIMLIVTAIGLLIAAVVAAYMTCEPFRNAVNAVGAAFMNALKPAIDIATGALSWLWHNVVEPFIGALNGLGNAVQGVANWFGGLFNQAGAATNQVDNASRSMEHLAGIVGRPPSTGLIESFEFLEKSMRKIEVPSISVSAVGGRGAGVVAAPTPTVNVRIEGPLVNVEGSADMEVANFAAAVALKQLKSVVVEASSQAATTKRIRVETAPSIALPVPSSIAVQPSVLPAGKKPTKGWGI